MNSTGPTSFFHRHQSQHSSQGTKIRLAVLALLLAVPTVWMAACSSDGSDRTKRDNRTAEELVAQIYDSTLEQSTLAQSTLETKNVREDCVDALVQIGSSALPTIRQFRERTSNNIDKGRSGAARIGASRGDIALGARLMGEVDARYLPVLDSYDEAIRRIKSSESTP